MLRQKLQDAVNFFKNQTVYVVGGGNSFTSEDAKLIKDKKIVAINSVFLSLPTASMIYWMDSSWPCKHLDQLEQHSAPFRFQSKNNALYQITHDVVGLGKSTYLNHLGPFGFSKDINSVYGNNSGTQVLNLLINLKVSKIVLLGFDMQKFNGKTHSHDDYYHCVTQDIYDEMFIPSMKEFNIHRNKYHSHVEIVNCSISSRLNCFKKDDLINNL